MDGTSRYPVPFVSPVLQECVLGWHIKALLVRPRTGQAANRVALYLMRDPNVYGYTEVAFFMEIDFRKKTVIFNACQENIWGNPERALGFPFHLGTPVNIYILNVSNSFRIIFGADHNHVLHNFAHRLNQKTITHVVIDGDFWIDFVYVNNVELNPRFGTQRLASPPSLPVNQPAHISRPLGFVTDQITSPEFSGRPHQQLQGNFGEPSCSHQQFYRFPNPPYPQGSTPVGPFNTQQYPVGQVPHSLSHHGQGVSQQSQPSSTAPSLSFPQLSPSKLNKKQLKKIVKYGGPIAAGAIVGGVMMKKGSKLLKSKKKHHGHSDSSSSSSSSD